MTNNRIAFSGPPNQKIRGFASRAGFSLIELMIAIVVGSLIMAAMLSAFSNISRSNNEMAKTNAQIESGRFAIQIIQEALQHAGFWGGYVPTYDNLSSTTAPDDRPTALPDPCASYDASSWDSAYVNNLIGIPAQIFSSVPTSCATIVTNKTADTDILVVRRVEGCNPGTGNCSAETVGSLYFQYSNCFATVGGASTSSVTLAPSAATTDVFTGKKIRIISGTGAGQTRTISGYTVSTRVATVDSAWTTIPDTSSIYTFGDANYLLTPWVAATGATTFSGMFQGGCATVSPKNKYISDIFYVRNYARTSGDGIPTLVRSSFSSSGPQTPEALIEGIEGFRVELGIDRKNSAGTTVNYSEYANAVSWHDDTTRDYAVNRGDGVADEACTTTSSCTLEQLANVVQAKIFVLARTTDRTLSQADTKTYTLGSQTLGPFNDQYKRHVFSSSVRLNNIAGRRETPK